MQTSAKVHVKVDTGMGRLGVPPGSLESFLEGLSPPPLIDVQLRTSEHRSMYSYVRLSIDDVQHTSELIDVQLLRRCTATYV